MWIPIALASVGVGALLLPMLKKEMSYAPFPTPVPPAPIPIPPAPAPVPPAPQPVPAPPPVPPSPHPNIPDYIPDPSSATATVVTAGGSLNVRNGPGIEFGVLGLLPNGAQVSVIQELPGWTRVATMQIEGYVSSQYLRMGSPVPEYKRERPDYTY